jgi:glyoxylase-like metal-dependent hydrolase (beta-lactamase superfamily II)
MKIKRLVVGDLESNGYIIYQKEGGNCYIIDPGYNPDKFIKALKEHKLNIIGILLTHHHYDHVGAVKKIKELKECPVYLHRGDLDMYKADVDIVMEDGDTISLEDETIKVLHTPGHTEGSVCFFSEKSKLVFTGDTIFNVDLGRTDVRDGDPRKMSASMKNVVNLWDNEIMIHPGHGDPCNMKFVRKMNGEFMDALSM